MTNPEPAGGTVPRWTVGDRLRKARIYADMTTDDMAADIGRTRRTISNYESDSTPAPVLVLRQYAMRTGVPLAWLEHGEPSDDGDDSPGLGISPSACYSRRAGRVVSLLTDVFPLAA